MSSFREVRAVIYHRMPLFFLGLAFSAGVYSVLSFSSLPLLLLGASLFFVFVPLRSFFLLFFVALLGVGWSSFRVTIPSLERPLQGVAECSLINISPSFFHKKQTWRCEFLIHSFIDEAGKNHASGIRAFSFQKKEWPLRADENVRFRATLQKVKGGSFQFSHIANDIQNVGRDVFSFVQLRIDIRTFLTKAFSYMFRDEEVSTLLGTLCFSLPCDQEMRRSVHKVGLDHVLGVSGFHFSQLAFMIALTIGCLNRWAFSFVSWGALTLFFLIVGPLPPVVRAWISSTLCIGQKIVGRSPNGFNSLGAGLLCLAVYDPCSLSSLSLQLSFIATWALMAWYPSIDRLLHAQFPHHSTLELSSFSLCDQLCACFLRFVRTSLAVGLSVSLAIIPYQLAFLSDFSLLGLIMNLVMPHFFDLALISTCALFFLYILFPPLTLPFAFLLEKGVYMLLNIIKDSPSPAWGMIQNIHIPEHIASLVIASIVFFGTFWRIFREYTTNERAKEWLSAV